MKNEYIFATLFRKGNERSKINRAISSAGSEHLVYTQRVGGSNPSSPTKPTLCWLYNLYSSIAQLVRASDC